jgi:hypothetical protein
MEIAERREKEREKEMQRRESGTEREMERRERGREREMEMAATLADPPITV